ncbi:MAG: SDR family oxidoreductase [Acidimicrobiales bacterium]
MTWNINGKHVLVTGGTSGIGRATAAQLASRGARVTITSRTLSSAQRIADELTAATGTQVEPARLDLASLDAVRTFAGTYADRHDRLDILVNNAGTMAGKRRTTEDGFEWTLAVNHLGPFLLTNLLTNLLTPLLIHSAPARVITVSSENHRGPKRGLAFDDLQMTHGYSPSSAYAASKLANILFTVELDRRLGPDGVIARALHPGVVATNFGKGAGSPRWMGLAMTLLKPLLATPEKGATTSVLLATAQPDELEASVYWASGKPKQPSDPALDQAAARRLWDLSAELVAPPS